MFDQMSTWQLYQMYSYFLLWHNMQDKNVFFLYVNSLIKYIYIYIYILCRTRRPLQTSWGKSLRYRGRMGLTMLFWGTDDWIPVHPLFIAAGVQPRTKKKKKKLVVLVLYKIYFRLKQWMIKVGYFVLIHEF
jgi:hypothetical protein